jgi:hypothetical protein
VRKGGRAGAPTQKPLEVAEDMLLYSDGTRSAGVEAVARGGGPGR